MNPMDLGIAQIGLSAADQQRLKAIMGMVIASGSLLHRWCMEDPATARLIIVAADSGEGMALLNASRNDAGKSFAVLAGESDQIPPNCIRLPWPLRIENVVSVLKTIERKVGSDTKAATAANTARTSSDSQNHIVRLASLLREVSGPNAGAVWHIKGLTRSSLFIAPGQNAFYFGGSLEKLRSVDLGAQLEFVPIPVEELPDRYTPKPIVMLQWLVGLLSGPLGLYPWIKPDSTLRLKRFPEFTLLHHLPEHRRIAAALARPRQGIEAIAEATSVDAQEVSGFVNATSLCGYLLVGDAGKRGAAAAQPPRVSGSRRALFQVFRKALGIVDANA